MSMIFGIQTDVEPEHTGDRAIGLVFAFWRWWFFIGWRKGDIL